MKILLIALAYLIFAPILGGLLMGLDRIITARIQRRKGPPLLQPFYDVFKLWQKENRVVRSSQNVFVFFYLIFMIFTGILFFTGGDLLLVIFSLTLASIFFVLGGFKSSSAYSNIGAERELIQILSYEPMVLLSVAGMYLATSSFNVIDILQYKGLLFLSLPGIFIGLLYVITIKFRKSPFDLSTSHHGHQELVKGITTEYCGQGLAFIELAHWYELIFIFGFIYLFFASSPILGILICMLVFLLEILIDNGYARVKWELTLWSSWLVALVFGVGNFIFLLF
jgi:formate hydrogenlyase subunit 4